MVCNEVDILTWAIIATLGAAVSALWWAVRKAVEEQLRANNHISDTVAQLGTRLSKLETEHRIMHHVPGETCLHVGRLVDVTDDIRQRVSRLEARNGAKGGPA